MRYILWLVVVPIVVVILLGVYLERYLPFEDKPLYTVSFSAAQARYLGFEPPELLQRIINDYQPEHFRLQANWNEIERLPGQYDFSELDALVQSIKQSGATITLAIGRKLPRWPECHDPDWLINLRPDEAMAHQWQMLTTVVEYYQVEPAIIRWQLENESLFAYGTCFQPNKHRLKRELVLLKKLDQSRPILLTDSGELSSWWELAALTPELGVTLYRVTWNPAFGYFSYPWPAYYYRIKAALISPWVDKIIVSELQLEPWAPQGLHILSLAEAQNSLSLEKFTDNLRVFRRTGFPEAILWGVEWWYYAHDRLAAPEYWQAGKELLN